MSYEVWRSRLQNRHRQWSKAMQFASKIGHCNSKMCLTVRLMMVNRLQMSMVFQQFRGHPYAHNPPACQIWKVVELRALFVYSKELLSIAVTDNLVQLHAPRVGGVHSYLWICLFWGIRMCALWCGFSLDSVYPWKHSLDVKWFVY